ncbi:alpha-ketoglutarate-dependent taurine dioxygenase-like [Ruditapes philippinarum]|uniref:alpha-ketoglutarate-dependent taurine dioxygenase-like n=1 Tax=Ruditapes philippinarum TaxID=129788 RepID=UPI00295AC9C1|nr:alpha-ketoglutarate-dependent taurine dioxygenase-like [Ruditapes philippinarum]
MEICVKKLGIEVRGVRLTDPTISSDEMVEQIQKLVTKHRILIFRDQGEVSGDKHAEISRWFGTIGGTLSKDDPLYSHPKCPHPDVYRISNDPEEGCINVGRSGWHIDGSYLHEPFGYALYHIIAVPKTGPTEFIGFKELINSISEETRARWERLWMVADKGENLAHPLIYAHPVTGESVMCIHLGMTKAFIWDKDTPNEQITNSDETNELLQEIRSEIEKDGRRLIYSHEWKDGDFLISDNLAVGHYASDSSARDKSEIGLRILHRTTVKGISRPTKMI